MSRFYGSLCRNIARLDLTDGASAWLSNCACIESDVWHISYIPFI